MSQSLLATTKNLKEIDPHEDEKTSENGNSTARYLEQRSKESIFNPKG